MTKNDGPKKRARATARKLGIPFSEAKTRRTAEAEIRKGNGRPGPITLKVHPGHLGFQWDRTKDPHAFIEGMPGSGKSRLVQSIAEQASAQGEAVIHATLENDGQLLLTISGPDQDVRIVAGAADCSAELALALTATREGRHDGRTMVIFDGFFNHTDEIVYLASRLTREFRVVGVTLVFVRNADERNVSSLTNNATLRISTGFGSAAGHQAWEGLAGAITYRSNRDEAQLTNRELTVGSLTRTSAVSFAANHAQNLTLATPSGRTRPTDRPVGAPVAFQPDDEVKFYGDRFWWTVQAVGADGTLVLTRKEAFGRDRGVYTIVHWGIGWRGPHDSWGHPAVTREDCEEVAAAIESEKDLLRLSVRNSVYLDLKKVRRGKLTIWEDGVPSV